MEPPYNFTVGETGLTGLSPFILTIIAEVISGPLNDWICVKLTKKNHGVYEPEFRLVLMSVTVILGTVGFFGFGLTVHHVTHWMGPVMTYGLANAALGFAAVAVFGYVIGRSHNIPTWCMTGADSSRFVPEPCRRGIRGDQCSATANFRPDVLRE